MTEVETSDDERNACELLVHSAIVTAIRESQSDGQRRIVGMVEHEDGTGEMAWPLEADAPGMLGFLPGWIITPEGEVIPTLGPREERRIN